MTVKHQHNDHKWNVSQSDAGYQQRAFHLKQEYKGLIKDSINSMSENLLAYKNLEQVKEMINDE